jgi:hypothetical protein
LGKGNKLKLYYEDLNIYEWVSGYIATIQYEPNPATARHMMTYLRNLLEDAVYHVWEPVKEAHSSKLTSLETGAFTWSDKIQMAQRCRSAINRASKVNNPPWNLNNDCNLNNDLNINTCICQFYQYF